MTKQKWIFTVAILAVVMAATFLTPQQAKGCNEGCTPGFWKNHLETPPWPAFVCTDTSWHWLKGVEACPVDQRISLAPLPWNTPVAAVFDLACLEAGGVLDLNGDGANDTLLDALQYKGGKGLEGKTRILLRIAVADVLNGMSQDHDPPFATINHVQTALAGFSWNGKPVSGACSGNFYWVEYWSKFLDDRANSQPCAFDD